MPPPLGTLDYAIWAYKREMERKTFETIKTALNRLKGLANGRRLEPHEIPFPVEIVHPVTGHHVEWTWSRHG